MTGPRDLNSPLPAGKICNTDGTPTLQFQAFIRRIWERTGYSPGDDAAWIAAEADIASLSAQSARGKADQALRAANDAQGLAALRCSQAVLAKAQDALDAATMALLQAQACETRALKALENAQELATLFLTARSEAQAAQSQNESMTFTVMNRPWPSSHNPS